MMHRNICLQIDRLNDRPGSNCVSDTQYIIDHTFLSQPMPSKQSVNVVILEVQGLPIFLN